MGDGMDTELVKSTEGGGGTTGGILLPAVIADAGEKASRRFVEFFTATIRNANTRQAYARAIGDFFAWCQRHRLELTAIEPVHVAAYIERLTQARSAPTVKQHLAAIRMCFDWLTSGGILAFNPASSVRGPKHVVKQGKTPVLTADEAKQLLASIVPEPKNGTGTPDDDEADRPHHPKPTIVQLRGRALIAVMVFSFARVSAALAMKVEDYYTEGRQAWFRLHEKGGKRHRVPAHHNAERYVDAYLDAAGIAGAKKTPLFRSIDSRRLTDRPMDRNDALRMIKRRARAAGLTADTCCHTFRATGITAYLEGGGTIEHAQAIANHESPKTTKLYDRTGDSIDLDEIEKIRI
jgi:site-specific recombinase XerD